MNADFKICDHNEDVAVINEELHFYSREIHSVECTLYLKVN